ncbi:DnaJ molecular chaperone [uncultured virus]|nr:DnaJ molecular chaperone [uncultured virus]
MQSNDNSFYYETLGISKDATTQEIKKKFKELAMKHHPDRLKAENKVEGEKKMQLINEAYKILGNPETRELYDKYGKAGLEESGIDMSNFGMSDIFSELFGVGGGRSQNDFIQAIEEEEYVTLEEIFNGKHVIKEIKRLNICKDCLGTGYSDKLIHVCKDCNGKGKTIKLVQIGPNMLQQAQVKCNKCEGTGQDLKNEKICKTCNGKMQIKEKISIEFDIDPGIKNEDCITIENQGHEYNPKIKSSKTRGKINILVKEKPHQTFKRGGIRRNSADLLVEINITLHDALCGFTKTIKHLDGRKLFFMENELIKEGDIKYIPGEGLPYRGKFHKKGDLYLKYQVNYPEKISISQKEQMYKILTGHSMKNIDFSIPNDHIDVQTINIHSDSSNNSTYDSDEENNHGFHQQQNVQCAQQ